MPPAGYPAPGTAQGQTGYVEIPGLGTAKLATIGQRLIARILDGILLWILAVVVMGIGGFGLFASSSTIKVNQQTGEITSTGSSGLGVAGFFLAIFVLVVVEIAYEVTLIALRGQTLGKQAMGVKVVLEANGQIPGWGPSFMRWILPAIGAFFCGQQGWHDKVAHDLVISTR